MKKITKAVIPAAGLGTRMLPIAHAVPKEMLPIVDRPAISYLIDECVMSGITDILIITNRDKGAIEDYFDYAPEYESQLASKGKTSEINEIHENANRANIFFIRQREAKGLGHAVGRAREFTGDDPFLVLYGDDVIFSDNPVCTQLIEAYNKFGLPAAAVKEVPLDLVYKYCSLGVNHIENNFWHVYDMIEKPKPEQVMSKFSILGRVLLGPEIYKIIDELEPGSGNEIQLTDAMRILSLNTGMTAVDFEGKRYDMGSKLGFLMANVERGSVNPETAQEFRKFLTDFVNSGFSI